ncbi:MAG: hypothetical protein Q7V63_04245 [Gammaproteobacteria bacterium]|nr:hypothetical protein [Gammaproteobacteria bacterium]
MLALNQIELSQAWQEASSCKRALMAGVAAFTLSAVAVGVAVSLSLGVPPDMVMHALHYGFEAIMLTKHITEFASKAWATISEWRAAKPVENTKIEHGCNTVLPFMRTLQASREYEPALLAAAA